MKNNLMNNKSYLSPDVEVVELNTEQGFAASVGDYNGFGDEIPF